MRCITDTTDVESERIVAEYAPLVKSLATSLMRTMPANVEYDDLVQDGFLGLAVSVIHSTKARADGHYKTYVAQRVRGAMLDGLRNNDPGSRKVRQAMRRVERTIHQLGHQLGRAPSEGEVATAMAMPLADYQKLLMEAHGYTLLSLEDFDDPDPNRNFIDWCADTKTDPLAALERKAVQRALLLAFGDLSVREEEVMTLHYVGDLRIKDIGERLGISAGRVSQIHAQAIAKLRASLLGDDKGSLLAPRWRTS